VILSRIYDSGACAIAFEGGEPLLRKDLSEILAFSRSLPYQRTENDAWTVRVAKTAEEAMELLKVGFDYVTEFEGLKLFRRRN